MHNGRIYFDEIKTIMISEPPQALLPLGSLYNVNNMHNGRIYFDEIKTIMFYHRAVTKLIIFYFQKFFEKNFKKTLDKDFLM